MSQGMSPRQPPRKQQGGPTPQQRATKGPPPQVRPNTRPGMPPQARPQPKPVQTQGPKPAAAKPAPAKPASPPQDEELKLAGEGEADLTLDDNDFAQANANAPAAPAKRMMPKRGATKPSLRLGKKSDSELGEPLDGEEDEEEEEEVERPIPTLKAQGMPLSIKFMFAITVTIAIVMTVVGVFIAQSSKLAISDEIDRAGVKLVKAIAAPGGEYWLTITNYKRSSADMILLFKEWSKIRTAIGGFLDETKPKDPNFNDQLLQFSNLFTTDSRVDNPLHILLKFGQGVESDLFDVGLFLRISTVNEEPKLDPAAEEQFVGNARGDNRIAIGEPAWRELKVDIAGREFTVEGMQAGDTTNNGRPTRAFKGPILDPQGNEIGKVMAFISAERIAEANKSMYTNIALYGAGGVVLGLLVAFGMSLLVTRPIKTLASDVAIVAQGDLEHKTVSHSSDEIGALATAFNTMTKNLREAMTEKVEAEAAAKALEAELNIASEIQQQLLPAKIPAIAGCDLFAYYRPSKEVGGDYYDFIPVDQNHFGLIVADVSGKGVPGALIMTMARSLLRMAAQRNLSAADTFAKVNRVISKDIRRGMFVTAVYLILDIQNREITVASAGHNPMYIYRAKTGKVESVNPKGIALGFDKGPLFERTVAELKVKLGVGDRVVLYTDGVVEAMNEAHEEYGSDRFIRLIEQSAKLSSMDFVHAAVKDLDGHKGDAPQHDDITIATFTITH